MPIYFNMKCGVRDKAQCPSCVNQRKFKGMNASKEVGNYTIVSKGSSNLIWEGQTNY